MKRCTFSVAAAVILSFVSTASASDMYWDRNDTNPGFFTPGGYADGTWDNAALTWNENDPTGTNAPIAWKDNADIAIFDVSGASPNTGNESDAIVTVSGTQTAGGLIVKSGWVELRGGTVALGANSATVRPGATLDLDGSARLSFTLAAPPAGGQVLLDGGTLRLTNTSTYVYNLALSNNGGTVHSVSGVPIWGSGANPPGITAAIVGEGGTKFNGGRQTLTKSGPAEFRVQGNGMSENTYAKLDVKEGLVRIGNNGTNNETAFGAVPLSLTTDQITLGSAATEGFLGSSAQHFSLHPNRGITLGAAGGGFFGSGGGFFTIPGPLTGSSKLIINGGGGITLNNPNNINTFTGAVEFRTGGSIFLNESLNATEISGPAGSIQVAVGKTFTVGANNGSSTWSGTISGPAGTLRKVGTGTLTLGNGILTGNVIIDEGTLQFTGSADLGDNSSSVTIATGAFLDMAGIVDIIGGLNGGGSVINHNAASPGAGGNTAVLADQMTLRGAKTYSFSGTIDGAGGVIHDGVGTQTFSGANTYTGGTTVSNGKMLINNTSGSGTGSGNVTVSGSGILGGSGIISGAVAVTGGQLNAGVGSGAAEDLVVQGAVTQSAGASIGLVLGDKLDVSNTANGLTLDAGGVLTILGKDGGVSPGTHEVVDYSGAIQGATVASMPINNASGYDLDTNGVFDDAGSTSIKVHISGTVQNRTWAGADGNWSYAPGDSGNWAGGTGGQANGPGAIANFTGTGGTVTITDSNKSVGELNLNSASSYTIAASGTNRLVTDAYGLNQANIVLATGSTHTISAPLTTNKNTNVNADGGTLNITGGIRNIGGLINNGAGTVAITSGNNTTQVIANNAAIANAGPGDLTITTTGTGILWNNSDGSIVNSGLGNLSIALNDATNIGLINNGLVLNSGAGNLTISGASTQSIASSNAVNNNLTAGISNAGTFRNTGTGTMTISANVNNAAGLIFGGNMTVSGIIGGGSTNNFGNSLGTGSSVTIDGAGTVVFSAANTFTGRLTLKSGTLQITADNQLGGVPLVAGGAQDRIIFDGGTLRSAHTAAFTMNANRGIYIKSGGGTIDNSNSTGTLTYAGRVLAEGNFAKTGATAVTLSGVYHLNSSGLRVNSNQGTLTLSGNTVGANTNVTMGGAGTITASGTIDVGTGALTKDSGGTLTLSGTGTNVMSALNFDGGRINFNKNSAAGTGNINVGTGAVTFGNTVAGVALANDVALATGSAPALLVTGGLSLDGTVSGGGSLNKTGAAIATLTGNNSYSGGTTVTAGTLLVNNTAGSGTGSNAVVVNGGNLGGTGAIGGGVTVNTTGHVAPGSSGAGTLSAASVDFTSGSFFDVQIGGLTANTEYDVLAVTGAAAINGGTLVPTLINAFVPTIGNTFTILTAANLTHPTDFVIDQTSAPVDTQWDLTYNSGSLVLELVAAAAPLDGDHNGDGYVDMLDYVVWRASDPTGTNDPNGYDDFAKNYGEGTPPGAGAGSGSSGAVPEPSTIALLMLGMAAAAFRRRSR